MAASFDKPTYPQIQKIWALAREKGLRADLVRGMTPHHSVGRLSKHEASILIDALIRGKAPDYSARPEFAGGRSSCRSAGRSRPRPAPGVITMPSIDQLNADADWVAYFCRAWRHRETGQPWTIKQFEEWMSRRHYSHGGPMHIIRTAADAAERFELFKGLKVRTEAAIAARAHASATPAAQSVRPVRTPRLAIADHPSPATECHTHVATA